MMRSRIYFVPTVVFVLYTVAGLAQYENRAGKSEFAWPPGKRGAVSLSFDDARASQLDNGIPILDRYGVKATFYVNPARLEERKPEWRTTAKRGHELGNHSLNHPCSANFSWSRDHALEEYSPEMIEREFAATDQAIRRVAGVTATTFAYPCGQKFIGRGLGVQSYVPMVAKHFLAGRGWLDETSNDPLYCDLAQIMGTELDGLRFDEARRLIDEAVGQGRWLVFCGHDVGPKGVQTTRTDTLEQICRYAADPANGIWLETVAKVAAFVRSSRDRL